MSKSRTITYWALAIIIALAYGFASFMKLSGNPMMVAGFAHFGYPQWFRYFIGASELAGALGLIFGGIIRPILPRLAAYGLMIIMVGAIVSHAIFDPIIAALPATILLILLSAFLYVGSPKRLERPVSPQG